MFFFFMSWEAGRSGGDVLITTGPCMCSCIDVFFPLTSVWNKNKDYCSCILLFPLLKIFKDFFGGVVFSRINALF